MFLVPEDAVLFLMCCFLGSGIRTLNVAWHFDIAFLSRGACNACMGSEPRSIPTNQIKCYVLPKYVH